MAMFLSSGYLGTRASQVIEQYRNPSREEGKQSHQPGRERPVKPGHTDPRGLSRRFGAQPPHHCRPKIVCRFGVISDRRERLFEQPLNCSLFPVPCSLTFHGLIPCSCKSFLSKRSARKTRSFTAVTEIPSASATSLCGR